MKRKNRENNEYLDPWILVDFLQKKRGRHFGDVLKDEATLPDISGTVRIQHYENIICVSDVFLKNNCVGGKEESAKSCRSQIILELYQD